MSYSIQYGNKKDLIRYQKHNKNIMPYLITLFFITAVVATNLFAPQITARIWDCVGIWDQNTINAFESMVENVQMGQPIVEAVDAFCRGVIGDANLWG